MVFLLISWPEMPLKENVDYKARLEKKLYLARENPEPIFDLSDCNLKIVPHNIFSLCRVFRKDALYLQKNKLGSLCNGGSLEDLILLSLLDISSNNFKKLPSDINTLENLKILNVSQNQIKELPETIGNLKNLHHLDASNNQLKCLPETIGGCESLEYLNIEGNKDLTSIPTSLSKIHCLSELIIGSEIVYPLPEICKSGVKAILKFLAQESGEEYDTPCVPVKATKTNKDLPLVDSYNTLQKKVTILEKMKDEKQKELLALEEQLINENRREFELHQSLKDRKKELVNILKSQQQSLDEEIVKVHANKEIQRALLIKECNNAEENAKVKIKQILMYSNALRERLARISDKERKEEEDAILSLHQNATGTVKPIEKAALLASMNELLKEEIKRVEDQSSDKRVKFVRDVLAEDKKNLESLRELMKKSDKSQNELLERIAQDEKLQRSAVSSLIERNDAHLWQIRTQVSSIESQLLVLTQVELTRKKLESETNLANLSESRLALTELLMELFRQQKVRKEKLIESLRKIEKAKEGGSETFWLEQYEKLLNSKSQQLVERLRKIDTDLANEFFLLGIFHYLPVLDDIVPDSVPRLENVTFQHLSDAGVTSEVDQRNILKAIRSYITNKRPSPTAPLDVEASAPFMSPSCSKEYKTFVDHNNECVICMDAESNVIFIPCGHICCCKKCSKSVSTCPLCRSPVKHLLEVIGSLHDVHSAD